MDAGPNIVVIMTDQQRWNTLGAYGNREIRTPHLDRLASEGVLFEQAFVPIPLCTPSRASLMTGQYPSRHGLRANETFPLPDNAPNLAQDLHDAGYVTCLSGKDHVFDPGQRSRLFDRVAQYNHAGRVGDDDAIDEAELSVREERRSLMGRKVVERDTHDPADCPTARITDAALDMVAKARERDRSFFLWLSYPDPHPPFVAPEPYASMYRNCLSTRPITRDGELDNKPVRQRVSRHLMKMDEYTDADLHRIREVYAGMITFIDDQVGRFVSDLQNRGLRENTILIFMSDHGEYLGDHGMIRKNPAMYDCLVRIPLFITWPGQIAPARITDTMAESVDLAPTILELAGLPIPKEMEGRSLAPLLRGHTTAHKDQVFGLYGVEGDPYTADDIERVDFQAMFEHPYRWGNWVSPLVMRGRFAMLRTTSWKLVHYHGGEGELYDLESDPDELYNRYGEPSCAAIQAELQQALIDRLLATLPVQPEYVAPDPPFRDS